MTKIVSMTSMNLVTPKTGAKHDFCSQTGLRHVGPPSVHRYLFSVSCSLPLSLSAAHLKSLSLVRAPYLYLSLMRAPYLSISRARTVYLSRACTLSLSCTHPISPVYLSRARTLSLPSISLVRAP
jgi:hypothetical protein